MVGCKQYEFVTIHLVYDTRKNKQGIETWSKVKPSEAPIPLFTWYSYAYQNEIELLPAGASVTHREWRITTGDEELFTFREIRFDQYCIFLGAEMYYWYFHQNESGTHCYDSGTELKFPHCGCCIPYQYEKIIQHIKDHFGDKPKKKKQ